MHRPFRLLLALCVLLAGTHLAGADEQSAIKARMSKRLPTILALAKRGAVGENNLGQLTPRGSLSATEKATVNAENSDRVAVYALIARKTGASPAVVGRQRAAQIRASAAKGTWIQKSDGSWVRAG